MPESPLHKLRDPLSPGPVTYADEHYVELDVTTNFSFLRGASHPDEMVAMAAELGYRAVAITDRNTLAGVVRAHVAAEEAKLKLIIGCRLTLFDAPELLVWCQNRQGYGNLCRLLTLGKSRVPKKQFYLTLDEFLDHSDGLQVAIDLCAWQTNEPVDDESEAFEHQIEKLRERLLALPPPGEAGWGPPMQRNSESPATLHPLPPPNLPRRGRDQLRNLQGGRLSLAFAQLYTDDNNDRLHHAVALSQRLQIPLLATNHVHYHDPGRRPLQDVLVCVREKCTIDEAGYKLFGNAERHFKSPDQMHRLFAEWPQAIARALEVADSCTFTLDELKYQYPHELVPPGLTPLQHLKNLTAQGAAKRFPDGVPERIQKLIEHEFDLIAKAQYEPYFLTVHDVVLFARSQGILCQGRGSAANSVVCYCLEITSVDPMQIDVLFERFVSSARKEPPDIDVDFEHNRREEVIQYVYNKYGRDRAAMCAEIISYRGRSSIRDVGKALGLGLDMVDSMAKRLSWWDRGVLTDQQVREAGLDPDDANVQRVLAIATQLLGFPRHLGQHVGGMVMTHGPLCEMVPIENASMPNRTVIEWDKDDIDVVRMVKVDCLALGMLTAISWAFRLLEKIETKRRRDEETKGVKKESDGQSKNLSGSTCMAAGHGTCPGNLSSDQPDATTGAIRADEPDAPISSIGTEQHCRGIRQAESRRLTEVSTDCPWIAERACHATRIGYPTQTSDFRPTTTRVDCRDRQSSPSPDSQLRAQTLTTACHFVSSSLRLFVSQPKYELHTIPPEDPVVYDMICRADTIGVFQIESRAQMSMLPRLRPREFYDLVIEVAIVRPGPIQGNMVHPYLRRRSKQEPVTYPSEALRDVLKKTLGVPLFQEQAMKIAMVGAGFSAEEADKLRRAMSAWRKSEKLQLFQEKIIKGMLGNGYTLEFAQQCFDQIKGFGEYGFPESHSASFARLVYVSAWLKCHHPAAFCAALLNSQPMGFYAPAQLVRDAREHGVEVRPADVNCSDWECTLEETQRDQETERQRDGVKREESPNAPSQPITSSLRLSVSPSLQPAVRLGLRVLKGIREEYALRVMAARERVGVFDSIEHFKQATGLSKIVCKKLAEADAFASLGLTRREAMWHALATSDEQLPLFDLAERDKETKRQRDEVVVDRQPSTTSLRLSVSPSLQPPAAPHFLPPLPLGQQVMTDYATAGLSLRAHPLQLVRTVLDSQKIVTAARIRDEKISPAGKWVRVAGLVLIRQRPGTASGIVFITLEDETGIVNLIVRPDIFDRYRQAARFAALLQAEGWVERQGDVIHIMAKRLFDRSDLIRGYSFTSRDFH